MGFQSKTSRFDSFGKWTEIHQNDFEILQVIMFKGDVVSRYDVNSAMGIDIAAKGKGAYCSNDGVFTVQWTAFDGI